MAAKQVRRAKALFLASIGTAGFVGSSFAADNTYSWVGPVVASTNPSWSVGTNWIGGVAPPQTPAAGDNTILSFGGALNTGTSSQNAVGGATNPADYTIYGLIFNDYTAVAGPGSLLLNTTGAGSRIINLGAGGIVDNITSASSAGTVGISNASTALDNRLILTADQTWNVVNAVNGGTAPTNNLVIKRPTSGAFTVTKTGLGTLQLSSATGNPNFNGTFDIQSGGFRLDTIGTQFASATATLKFDTNNDASFSASTAGINQTINGAFYAGGTGSLFFSGSADITFTGAATLTAQKTMSQGGTRTTNFDGPVMGPGGITKFGSGTIAFHGNNTYAGDTTVGNGTLSIGTFGQLGTATTPITLGGSTGAPPPTGTLHITGAAAVTSRAFSVNVGGGNLSYADTLTINNSITGTGPLTKVGAGALNVQQLSVATFTALTGTTKLTGDGSDGAVSRVRNLALGGTTGAWTNTLDVGPNSLIVDYDSLDPTPFAQIADQIKSGYAGGAWTGTGIQSSAAAASGGQTGLGFAEASTVLGAGGGTWRGQTVDGNAILIRRTYYGDANISGTVDTVDFNLLVANFSQTGKSWYDGDFDHNGTVDTVDFNQLVANFSKVLAAPAGVPGSLLVPEPASGITVASLAALGLRRRRRTQPKA
jgi:autotransporter-associated beta strand protein